MVKVPWGSAIRSLRPASRPPYGREPKELKPSRNRVAERAHQSPEGTGLRRR